MSRSYPDRPIVGVGAVVWRDGQVLLPRRGRPPPPRACASGRRGARS